MKNKKTVRLLLALVLILTAILALFIPSASAEDTVSEWFAVTAPTGSVSPADLRSYWNSNGWPEWCSYSNYARYSEDGVKVTVIRVGITENTEAMKQYFSDTLSEPCFVVLESADTSHEELMQIYSNICQEQRQNPIYNEIYVIGDQITVVASDLFLPVARLILQNRYREAVTVVSKFGTQDDLLRVDNFGFEVQHISASQPWFELWCAAAVIILAICIVLAVKCVKTIKKAK